LGLATASFFSSSKVDEGDDLSGCGELLPKSFKMSKMGFTASCPQCEDGKVKAKVSYDPGRWLPTIDIMDASADIELKDNGDSVTIEYENLDLGPLNHHMLKEYSWFNLSKGSYTYDKFAKGKDTLKAKEALEAGETLVSKNRLFQLEMQEDGNLVLAEAAVINFTLWETGTEGGPGRAVLESNGDFVVYNKKKKNVWHSDTADQKISSLKLRNDGNIVLYSGSNAIWQSGETCEECDEDAEVAESTKTTGTRSYLERVTSFFKSSEDEHEDEDEGKDKESEKNEKKKEKKKAKEEEEEEEDEEEADEEEEDEEKEEKKKAAEEKKKKEKAKKAKASKDKAKNKKEKAKDKQAKAKDKKSKAKKGKDGVVKKAVKSYIKKKAAEYVDEEL
jgi:chemotaxis protein histidine kinase CheA